MIYHGPERCIFFKTEKIETDRLGSFAGKRWFCLVAGTKVCENGYKKDCGIGAYTPEDGQSEEEILDLLLASPYVKERLKAHDSRLRRPIGNALSPRRKLYDDFRHILGQVRSFKILTTGWKILSTRP